MPAILELKAPTGGKYPVALVGLGEETATLALGGEEYTFPLREVDALWDGVFVLLRRVPPIGSRLISLGARGKDVGWIRARLNELQGEERKPSNPEVYDEILEQRVRDFQRSRSLVPDGVVGEETLTQLVLATRDPRAPSLTGRVP